MHHLESTTLQGHGVIERLEKGASITKHYRNPAKRVVTDITITHILNKKAVAESMPNHMKQRQEQKRHCLSPFLNVP